MRIMFLNHLSNDKELINCAYIRAKFALVFSNYRFCCNFSVIRLDSILYCDEKPERWNRGVTS
jgi:hypothetical protein